MKMKITTAQAVNAYNALTKLATMETSFSTAIDIAKNLQVLEPVVKVFGETNDKELKKYGKKDDKGELIIGEKGAVELADPKKFNEKYIAMLETEVDVDLEQIKGTELKAIKKKDGVITPAEIVPIMFLIN